MAYSGIYKVKNKEKYIGNPNNVFYRSLWERQTFVWADISNSVSKWSSEEIVIPYVCGTDGKVHKYFVDLFLKMSTTEESLLVEIKPHKETIKPIKPKSNRASSQRTFILESYKYIKNISKWEAATKFANSNGWKFVIWDENMLQSLGIRIIKRYPTIRRFKKLLPITTTITPK
jgi:hypothetical protein